MLLDWGTVTLQALQTAWQGFLNFIPVLIGAIIVFVIGWFIAIGVGKLIAEILARLKFNKLFEKTGWKGALEKAELKVNPSDFIGAICKWILVIVFLLAAVEILGFVQFANFLRSVISWLPNLVVAIAIFVVAIILADILEKIVRAGVKKLELGYAEFLGAVVRWAIYVFAGLAILLQLGVTPTIINTLVIGFVGMIALALGLAFGLGGKEAAAKLIEKIGEKISER
jgi:small-conductance mechanosensitive channel